MALFKTKSTIYAISASLACSVFGASSDTSQPAAKRKKESITIDAEIYVGAHHDSNVNVSELDKNTDASDSGVKGVAKAKLTFQPDDKWQVNGAVQHSDTRYNNLSEFDLSITTLSGEVAYSSTWAKLGVHHYHASADLNGAEFLTYQQSGISIANSAFTKGYWRLSVDNIDKTFNNSNERNSTALSTRVDGFWFFDNQSFIQLGLMYQRENADSDVFDYKSHGFEAAYNHSTQIFTKPATFSLAYQLENRRYDSSAQTTVGDGVGQTSQSTLFREDDREGVKASIKYEVLSNMNLIVSTQYRNYSSTLASADYEEVTAEFGVNFHF